MTLVTRGVFVSRCRVLTPVWCFFILICFAQPLALQAKLNVVATLPDFAALAQEVGGDLIKVTALAKGTEDAHFVDARPSFIRVLNQADVLLEGGAELEIGWLPPLVNNARNARILPGKPGRVTLAQGLRLLEVPTAPVDRSQGDVHAVGNPHYWMDPVNGRMIAERLAEVFGELDPPNAARYQENLKKFSDRLSQKLADWTRQMEPYRGTKVLTYHKSYEYFTGRFGLQVVGQLEPKPGLEPSATHINALINRAKEQGVKLVLIEPFRARKTPEHVATAIGAKVLVVPDKVGANEKVQDYLSLFDYAVAQITAALGESK
jgi:ABC-type Zn uptake system ZnuABC Zn-binding protein ZnuA